MDGLIMDYQLNVPAILRRGEQLFGDKEIVTRLPDKSWHRYTYAEFAPRATRLAAALRNELGPGGRRPRRHLRLEPLRAPRDATSASRSAAWSRTRSTSGCTPTT